MELVVRIVFGVLSVAGLTVGFIVIIRRLEQIQRKVDDIASRRIITFEERDK